MSGDAVFDSITIKDFRALQNQEFKLGKYVTMLAGWNATGKSTVLALLANSTELKEKSRYGERVFRAQFEEILKGNKQFDKTQSDRLVIKCSSGEKKFRTAWQQERFRVIPKDLEQSPGEQKTSEAKFTYPVIYLGLSRLFPIGEVEADDSTTNVVSFHNTKDAEWFRKNYSRIISKDEVIQQITKVDVKAAKKDKWGISTDSYGWQANSSGQDNVSQILYSLLSFKALKNDLAGGYEGGIFLIDELDAALHPKAQRKILDLLIKEAKEMNVQIVFTTHSLSLIEYFYEKKNGKDKSNIISYYFTYENEVVSVSEDYSYEQIKQDTLLPLLSTKDKKVKITVYTEDEEARWLLKKLLKGVTNMIDLRNIAIGCSSLVDLMNCEPCFLDYIVVFDGDFSNIKRIKKNNRNYILLPSTAGEKTSPEQLLRDFILSDKASDYLLEASNSTKGQIKLEYFKENDIEESGNKKDRELYKDWFKKHKDTFEKTKIYDFWEKKNPEMVEKFQCEFLKIYNKIAQRIGGEFKIERVNGKLKKSTILK